jgi:hypothetical protein
MIFGVAASARRYSACLYIPLCIISGLFIRASAPWVPTSQHDTGDDGNVRRAKAVNESE